VIAEIVELEHCFKCGFRLQTEVGTFHVVLSSHA